MITIYTLCFFIATVGLVYRALGRYTYYVDTAIIIWSITATYAGLALGIFLIPAEYVSSFFLAYVVTGPFCILCALAGYVEERMAKPRRDFYGR